MLEKHLLSIGIFTLKTMDQINISQLLSSIFLSNTLMLASTGIYLLTLKKRTRLEKYAILILAFMIFHALCAFVANLFFYENLFFNIGAPFSLFYGVFLFAFVFFFSKQEKQSGKIILWHFIIPLLYSFAFLIILSGPEYWKDYIYSYILTLYVFTSMSFVMYAAYTYYIVKTKKAVKNYLNVYKNLLTELLILLCCVAVLFIGYTFGYKPDKSGDRIIVSLIHFALFAATGIIFRQLIKNNYKEKTNNKKIISLNASVKETDSKPQNTQNEMDSKYKKSKLTDSILRNYVELLENIDNTYYLNPELSLQAVAKKIGISKYNLTQVFSAGLDTNFNQYVNKKRLTFAVEFLKSEDDMSMESIAYACGFNSRTSFYRAFSNEFKITPTQFKNLNSHNK